MVSREINSITIVLPAYKQEDTIVKNITILDAYLSGLSLPYELIVVIDGLVDKTYEKAKALKLKNLKIYVIPKNVGKGYAVRYGMLQAKNDVIGFIDAGMDLDMNGIGLSLDYMKLYDADVIIGSKLHPDSVIFYPIQRKILSKGYRTLTKVFFGFSVRDTQVGLKLFRKNVVYTVFPRLLVKRFAFDVEILAVAYSLGFKKIYEAPVKLTYNWKSSIMNVTSFAFWEVIFNMLWDTAAVFYRLKILHYYDTPKQQHKNIKKTSQTQKKKTKRT